MNTKPLVPKHPEYSKRDSRMKLLITASLADPTPPACASDETRVIAESI
jgi:hypothetical protein